MQTAPRAKPDTLQVYGSLGGVSIEAAMSLLGLSQPNEAIDFESALTSTPDISLHRTTARAPYPHLKPPHPRHPRSKLPLRSPVAAVPNNAVAVAAYEALLCSPPAECIRERKWRNIAEPQLWQMR